MRDELKSLRENTPTTQSEWMGYFKRFAMSAGFDTVIEEDGHGDVFVKEHSAKPGAMLGTLVMGKDFLKRFTQVYSLQPDIFKKFLEHTVVHHAGEVITSGMVYSGMEGMATIVGAEKLGYSAEEIVDLLATGVVMGYLASRNSGFEGYEEYLQKAEFAYDVVFWDFLTKEEVTNIIAHAREMRSALQNRTRLGAVRPLQKKN